MHLDLQAQNWIVYTVVSLTAIRLFFPLLSVIRELIGKPSGSETEDLGCYSGVCKSCDINPSSKKDNPILH
ncbi:MULTISPECIES: hypothetical protein [Leptospira]|uniref:Uncharacterized protein n=1 Tax=Leptospira santarosai str. CBC1416 TaxID=1193059 RepID=M6VPG9_9LEPT|nr:MULTISPECIES: hypothetical protein [Leptospira]EMO58695.1 hypothetical protein LEP1GSC161_4024 [Leptospira santarosai str. CBC1416]AVV81251.1 Uncharacterized protein XB15_03514 [Leptospira santarosai]EKR90648.1 hypothetical protein LEP1GSC163_1306 [Leptospira santarosai str. CBC379]EMO72596.1 hypothetical protein LEP1GSC130_0475 [Leptospira santarosai str. 200403458]EMO85877.1 hypothetical protein LEP1GSC070_1191 [Leptospira santarosai str. AIM]